MINKDEVKGKAKEVTGGAKRKVGEIAGSEKMEIEGGAKEIAGKVQKNWGKVKHAAEDATNARREKKRA